ncbi:transforming growth factor-beta-induced protein ig-h3 isoform X2 [Zootermopsis nevadensis]|uniref:transforming growth factor-beta-induced protein ig-h3 isoform X2 n=1 Tax=Zootermopsis nevadensis TaxID=136037 RepID=UPI000B8E3412|nr:transforming growth factor-beta-induced protein ig-h3 isoform X2 [Zootermopsis nevadensis]
MASRTILVFALALVSVSVIGAPPELPDTSGIDYVLTDNLNVDQFFSLWLVFNNDDVKMSEPFTIFAPRNSEAPLKDAQNLLAQPDLVKRLLIDHIVLGLKMNLNLTGDFTITTLGGRTVNVRRVNGTLYANGAKILEPRVEVPHGILVVVDNYLFPEELILGNQSAAAEESLVTGTAPDNPRNITFLENVNQVLSYLKSGVRVFQQLLGNSNISGPLKDGEEYTVFVPTDRAFQRWHPIDWGFYPFSVPEFTEDIILNHFVRGNWRQDTISDGQKVTTLGGRDITFGRRDQFSTRKDGRRNSVIFTVNGVQIVNGDTPVENGNIMFISEVLFVNEEVVTKLHQQNRDKETPPLLAYTWMNSPFISHAYLALQKDPRFTYVTQHINLADVAPVITGHGYTFFVPTDNAFKEVGLGGKPEFYLSRGEGLKLLLNHFVPTRLYNRDLINGQQYKTLGGKTIHVKRDGENVTIGDAKVIESEVFVYNLGTMYYIDRVLFITGDDIPVTTEVAVSESSTTWTSELPHDVEALPSELTEESGTLPDALFEPDDDSPTEELDTVLSTTSNRAEGRTEENTDGTFFPLEFTTIYAEHALREGSTTEIPENQNSSTGILNSSVSLK